MSITWFDDAQSADRVASFSKTAPLEALDRRRRKPGAAILAAGIAAVFAGAGLAAFSMVDVPQSSAHVAADTAPVPEAAAATPVASITRSIPQAATPAFATASLDGNRMATMAATLQGFQITGAAGFMLAGKPASSGTESHGFLPTEVMRDDADSFRPVLLASLAPAVDPERFAIAEMPAPLTLDPDLPADGASLAPLLDSPGQDDGADAAQDPGQNPDRDQAAVPVPAKTPDEASATPDETDGESATQAEPEPQHRQRPVRRLGPDGRPMSIASSALAYAPADDLEEDRTGAFEGFRSLFNRAKGLPGPGSGIAVYDITNAVVYMPNGQRLEAHSGLGKMQDKPRYAHIRMKGPTPPNIYNLRMREALFHGVEAIRLLPTDRKAMKGRDGILAHTYLLGNTKSSNGCVSFEDYDKFLAAFKRGEVKKMIVIPDMTHLPTYMARLEPETVKTTTRIAASESYEPAVYGRR